MARVNVLLCTYNGAAYLDEQIESLFAQSYRDIHVIVKDDGSTDGTKEVLRRWDGHAEDGIRLDVAWELEEGCGYPACFFCLLDHDDSADYYAFCDQDDVWLPEKVARAVTALDAMDASRPALYYADYDYYDEELRFLHHSYYAEHGIVHPTLSQLAFGGHLSGCTMVINRMERELCCKEYRRGTFVANPSKDVFIGLTCAALGSVTYDPWPCLMYRRHASATTFSGYGVWRERLNKFRGLLLGNNLRYNTDVVEYLLDQHADELNGRDLAFCRVFARRARGVVPYVLRLAYPRRMRVDVKGEAGLRLLLALDRR